jgi:hypothetical protein
MRIIWVESTVVAIHCFATFFADITELCFIATDVHLIFDVVVLICIYKFIHTDTVPHGFLKCCLNQILRNAPLPPIIINGGSGSWNQTYVVTVI